jgi:hypothetical protein
MVLSWAICCMSFNIYPWNIHQSSILSSHLLPHCHESAPVVFRPERHFKFFRLIRISIPLVSMRIESVSIATGIIHSYSALK